MPAQETWQLGALSSPFLSQAVVRTVLASQACTVLCSPFALYNIGLCSNARKRIARLKTRSKPLERNQRTSNKGANHSNETREFQMRLEKMKTRSEPIETNYNISESRPPERDKRIRNQGANHSKTNQRISQEGANRSKETRVRLEYFERDQTN